jgi:hypothetical protein
MHETDRLVVRFGPPIPPAALEAAPDAAELVMREIRAQTPSPPIQGQ